MDSRVAVCSTRDSMIAHHGKLTESSMPGLHKPGRQELSSAATASVLFMKQLPGQNTRRHLINVPQPSQAQAVLITTSDRNSCSSTGHHCYRCSAYPAAGTRRRPRNELEPFGTLVCEGSTPISRQTSLCKTGETAQKTVRHCSRSQTPLV